ncbi:hypothetical protein J3459_021610 [Metarhizium acridum]|nr:hypothetical protein J3459_021610 [Metarhizium acridum]
MSAGGTYAASPTAVTTANDSTSPVKLAVPGSATTPEAGDASAECSPGGKGDNGPSTSERVSSRDLEVKENIVVTAARDLETIMPALAQGEVASTRRRQGLSGESALEKQLVPSPVSEESPTTKDCRLYPGLE